MDAALASPFGSATLSDLPGPWLVNSALAAGWLGSLLLVWFLARLGRQLDAFNSASPPRSARRLGCILLVGTVATVVVFNDYQMGNYSGLVLLAFIYRTVQLGNQRINIDPDFPARHRYFGAGRRQVGVSSGGSTAVPRSQV
jgi:hypothetical protein